MGQLASQNRGGRLALGSFCKNVVVALGGGLRRELIGRSSHFFREAGGGPGAGRFGWTGYEIFGVGLAFEQAVGAEN